MDEAKNDKVDGEEVDGNASRGKGINRNSSRCSNVSSPLLKEPFKDGWRREVVYRATVQPGAKTLCDVYYYTPDGKKLRSGREVADYLRKHSSPYTSEHFTFFKAPIGMDTQFEILRDAKQRDAGHSFSSSREKSLRARQVKRNLKELAEDVVAINKNAPTGTSTTTPTTTPTTASPPPKKKGTKAPAGKENLQSLPVGPAVPDDISHLFTPFRRSLQPTDCNRPDWLIQNLESINGKRFVSICTNLEPGVQSPGKRTQSSPDLGSPSTSPKRLKLEATTPTRAPSTSGAWCWLSGRVLVSVLAARWPTLSVHLVSLLPARWLFDF